MIGIYKVTNHKGAIYIGQSRNIKKRFNAYRNKVEKNRGQPKLYNSLLKYGHETHTFEVIQECRLEELNIFERYWQEYYNACDRGNLNCTLTSIDETPHIVSADTRRKISEAATKRMAIRVKDPAWMERMRENGRKRKGKKMPAFTESHREGIRQANYRNGNFKGENNPWFGVDRSGDKNTMYGRTQSPEARAKISAKAKGRVHSEEAKRKMSEQRSMGRNVHAKLILNTDTGIYYECGKEAWMTLSNYAFSTFRSKMNGKIKKGLPFKYV